MKKVGDTEDIFQRKSDPAQRQDAMIKHLHPYVKKSLCNELTLINDMTPISVSPEFKKNPLRRAFADHRGIRKRLFRYKSLCHVNSMDSY